MRRLSGALLILLAPATTWSQHDHGHDAAHPAASESPSSNVERVLDMPMQREGSGTAWLPDASPMHARHWNVDGYRLMLHAAIFAGYDYQDGPRGDESFESINWIMFMVSHSLLGGELAARIMLSAEPWTAGGNGYPLLLQTGESFENEALHDRQHPHDLFMETALTYTHELTGDVALQVYLAPAGEPALGPVAFPHRPSAAADPLAPLGHHWQDATHITYGVVTLGAFTRFLKVEGSVFNGREPDEERLDFDLRRLDAFSGRVSINPADSWSAQVSAGRLQEPEFLEPGVDLTRITASVAYGAASPERYIAALALWGRNVPSEGPSTDAFLLEATAQVTPTDTVFMRAELTRKSGHDLVLAEDLEGRVFTVGALAIGYVRDVDLADVVRVGLGARGALNFVGTDLESLYGSRTPVGGMVFIRVIPTQMAHGEHM